MTDILLRNCLYLLTMDSSRQIVKDGAVAIEDGRIIALGKTDRLKPEYASADRVIDCSKSVVLPGLINTHCHSTQQLARGLADNLLFPTWIHERVYPYESSLTEREAYLAAMACCIECIKTGTTTFLDPGGYRMEQAAKAVEESGIRAILSRSAVDITSAARVIPGIMSEETEAAVKASEEFVRSFNGKAGGRIRAWYAPRTERMVSTELLKRLKELADKYRTGITFHTASTQDSVLRHKELFHGLRPIERCNEAGVLDSNLLVGEANWVTDEEVQMLKHHDVKVFHIPSGSFHGAYGALHGKHLQMMKMGITVSLAHDTAPESNFNDMFRVMYCVVARRDYGLDPTLVPAEQILDMCIVNGAKACLWDDEIGSVELGKKADLMIVDAKKPEMIPLHNPVSNIVHSACGYCVDTSIIDGKIVMENRQLKTVDEEKLLEEANEVALEIAERTGVGRLARPRWPVS